MGKFHGQTFHPFRLPKLNGPSTPEQQHALTRLGIVCCVFFLIKLFVAWLVSYFVFWGFFVCLGADVYEHTSIVNMAPDA